MADIPLNDVAHALETLSCEIGVRPAGAPAIGKVAQLARSIDRRNDALVVTFDASAATDVKRFAAAERTCCSTISWDVRRYDEGVELTVLGSREQLHLLERLFASAS